MNKLPPPASYHDIWSFYPGDVHHNIYAFLLHVVIRRVVLDTGDGSERDGSGGGSNPKAVYSLFDRC